MTRIQFSRRHVIATVVLIATLLLLGLTVGWEVALAALAVILVAAAGAWCLRRRHFVVGTAVLAILGLVVCWMLFVDLSLFVESCPDCHLYHDVLQFRVLGIPVHEIIRPADATFARVAEDLGHPCPHRFQRWHKVRLWGLVYARWPNINGITRLTGGDEREDGVDTWYDDRAAAIVRAAGKSTAGLGDEFFRRACLDKDWCYLWKFMDAVRAKRVVAPNPSADLVSDLDSISRDSVLAAATALTTADLVVVPDPQRQPSTEEGMFGESADIHFACPQCNGPMMVTSYEFLRVNYNWQQHVSLREEQEIAQILELPRRAQWYGEDWTSHDDGNAVIGVQTCEKCGSRCFLYVSYRLVGRGRYSVTLQGLARLPRGDVTNVKKGPSARDADAQR